MVVLESKDKKHHTDYRYEIQSLYWAHNKRFWTCLRCFLPQNKEELIEDEKEPKFALLGVFWEEFSDYLITRMVYWRRGENPNIKNADLPQKAAT